MSSASDQPSHSPEITSAVPTLTEQTQLTDKDSGKLIPPVPQQSNGISSDHNENHNSSKSSSPPPQQLKEITSELIQQPQLPDPDASKANSPAPEITSAQNEKDDSSKSSSTPSQQSDEITSDKIEVDPDASKSSSPAPEITSGQTEKDDSSKSSSTPSQQSDEITSDKIEVDPDANKSSSPAPPPIASDLNTNADSSKSPPQSTYITSGQREQTQLPDKKDFSKALQPSHEITPDPNPEDADKVVSADQNEVLEQDTAKPAPVLTSSNSKGIAESNKSERPSDALIVLVRRELEYIKDTAAMLGVYGTIVENSVHGSDNKIKEFDKSLKAAMDNKQSDEVAREKRVRDVQKDIRLFKKHLRKLKLTVPPKFKVDPKDQPELAKYLSEYTPYVQLYTSDNKQILGKLDLFKEKVLYEYRSAFKDFEVRFKTLDYRLKMCLLCFSVIPENEVIKKRLMVYWWIGEGFIFPETDEEKNQDLEQLGAKTFDDLLDMDFIYSADSKDSQEVDNCKMDPFVRWAIILMAERAKFFEFDNDGSPTEDYSSCFRACLAGNGLDVEKSPDLEKLHMLFNVNEAILELKPEWLLKMRNISILCLGRWQAASEHHIEVEDTKFLQGLKNMIHLRYLSLQGISRITELPNSVSSLTKLTMLDLRACHNLEIIPHDIGLLKLLTHLDLSDCYLLNQMPKGISKLSNLIVLKGFLVVDDAKKDKICTLEDLAKLKKLRKLSIFTGVTTFPGPYDLLAFQNFEELRKLKIVWGGKKEKGKESKLDTGDTKTEGNADKGVTSKEIDTNISSKPVPETPVKVSRKKRHSTKHTEESPDYSKLGLPLKLEKLDLQCYPQESAPEWLKPRKLDSLKKLYIRGGQLCDLNLTNENWKVEPWNVETLRLKYLTGLGMNWTELLDLFPKLIYLEKVRCPKLTLFPCNDKGMWVNKAKLPKQA